MVWLGPLTLLALLLLHSFALASLALWLWLAALAMLVSYLVKIKIRTNERAQFKTLLTLSQIGVLVCAICAWASYQINAGLADRLLPEHEGIALLVTGVVIDLPVQGDYGQRFRFALDEGQINGQTVVMPSIIQLNWPNPKPKAAQSQADDFIDTQDDPDHRFVIRAAQRWQLNVRLRRPHSLSNPLLYDGELRALQDAIGATGSVIARADQSTPNRLLQERVWHVGALVQRARQNWGVALDDSAKQIHADQDHNRRALGLVKALSSGEQNAVTAADWSLFNRTGVSHLMSISGLHITMLAAMAAKAAGWFWKSVVWCIARLAVRLPSAVLVFNWLPSLPRFKWLIAVLVGGLYSLFAGWGIPAQRTFFTVALAGFVLQRGRNLSFFQVLQAIAVLLVLIDPWAVFSPGFWLSFGAVAIIVWHSLNDVAIQKPAMSVPLKRPILYWQKICQSVRQATRTQWACTIMLLPVGAWYFSGISVIGPLANAIAIPLVSGIITPLCLLVGALASMHLDLAHGLLSVLIGCIDWLFLGLQFLDQLPLAAITTGKPAPAVFALSVLAAGLLLAPMSLWAKAVSPLALMAALYTPAQPLPADTWRATFLDVGQGSAVLIESANVTLLFDTGTQYSAQMDIGRRVLLPYLKARGIERLDYLVISHLNKDYSGGAASVVAGIKVGKVFASLPLSEDDPLIDPERALRGSLTVGQKQRQQILEGAAVLTHALGPWQSCERGHQWTVGQIKFEFLHPTREPEVKTRSMSNAMSCVLSISGPTHRVLLTGGIEAAQEKKLIAKLGTAALKADVLQMSGQGANSASSAQWIQAVGPQIAVAQVGYRNRQHLPHQAVLDRFQTIGTRVLKSDQSGAIVLTFTSNQPIQVEQHRLDDPPYWRVFSTTIDQSAATMAP